MQKQESAGARHVQERGQGLRKLVYLILWIVSLLALILYLLIVEYLHEEMKKKSVLGEMSSEELMKILKEENSK